MKFIIIIIIITYSFVLENSFALNVDKYTAYIEELIRNEKFLETYKIWSLELFSQSDYAYGNAYVRFSCPIEKFYQNISIPTSVHTLQPNDIECIGAMGDSLTTGLGVHAIAPMDLLLENRGMSWSIGGDYTFSQVLSLPNVLRQYNPNLKGFSSKSSIVRSSCQNNISNELNVAKSWDTSSDMISQAELLIEKLKNKQLCDWNDDWKMITMSVGNYDLCNFCKENDTKNYTPEHFVNNIREALDKLYDSLLPRTLINLVFTFDIHIIQVLSRGNYICQELYKRICPCVVFPTEEQTEILNTYSEQYYKLLSDLIHSERYEKRDDFTVIIQPYMAHIKLPYKDNNEIDYSYFAPDCFHFSGKGHSLAGLSLWNNMFEPVGGKTKIWPTRGSLRCPTKEYPYIFTLKNSAKALNELKSTIVPSTPDRMSTIGDKNSTHDYNLATSLHNKHRTTESKLFSKKLKVLTMISFLFIIVTVLIVGIIRRRKFHLFIQRNKPHHFNRADNSQYQEGDDDDDEVEIWSVPKKKVKLFRK